MNVKLPPPYPLAWPAHWPRTEHPRPERGDVGTRAAFRRLFSHLLRHSHPRKFRITSNVHVDSDGFPLNDFEEPKDGGVCVVFASGLVFPFDRYQDVAANFWGLGQFLGHFEAAMREAPHSYIGFMQSSFLLPEVSPAWVEVLFGPKWSPPEDPAVVERQFRLLSLELHPDRGGSESRYREIVVAREAARKWYEERDRERS